MPKMVRAYLRADLSSDFRSLANMVLIVLDAIVSPARSQYVRRPDHEEVVGDPLQKAGRLYGADDDLVGIMM